MRRADALRPGGRLLPERRVHDLVAGPARLRGARGHACASCARRCSAPRTSAPSTRGTPRASTTAVAARLRAEVASLLADPAHGAAGADPRRARGDGRASSSRSRCWRPSDEAPRCSDLPRQARLLPRRRTAAVVMFKGSMNETWSGSPPTETSSPSTSRVSWLGGRERERVERRGRLLRAHLGRHLPGADRAAIPGDGARRPRAGRRPGLGGHARAAARERRRAGDAGDEDPLAPRPAAEAPPVATASRRGGHNGRRGILAFATGAGKTFTALDGDPRVDRGLRRGPGHRRARPHPVRPVARERSCRSPSGSAPDPARR